MKKVLCPFLVLLISTNIAFADYDQNIKDLGLLQNRIDVLYSLLLQNAHKPNIEGELKFIGSQISYLRNNITNDLKDSPLGERVRYISALSVLNYFEIAYLLATDYYKNPENEQNYKGGLASFYEGKGILSELN